VPHDARLILLPGLGADERMFAAQRAAFPWLEVPRWFLARPHETLGEYARRMADAVDTPSTAFIGGSSFGGAVALEMARFVNPRGVFLIGSLRTPGGVPAPLRWAARAMNAAPGLTFRAAYFLVSQSTYMFGDLTPEQHRLMAAMMRDADPRFVQWGTTALSRWAGAPPLSCPIHQIHGGADRILPCRSSGADVIVPGGTHLLNVTHADAVNAFIAERMT
jgi:pimeloyl-ACP methyl ester carboxylesterase